MPSKRNIGLFSVSFRLKNWILPKIQTFDQIDNFAYSYDYNSNYLKVPNKSCRKLIFFSPKRFHFVFVQDEDVFESNTWLKFLLIYMRFTLWAPCSLNCANGGVLTNPEDPNCYCECIGGYVGPECTNMRNYEFFLCMKQKQIMQCAISKNFDLSTP